MGYVYLIRNGGLHKIGRTDNLQQRMRQLDPDAVVQVLETDRSRDLEFELHKKFKQFRLPQTEYFRLGEAEVNLARVALGWDPEGPVSVPAAHLVDEGVYKAKGLAEVWLFVLAFSALGMLVGAYLPLLHGWWELAGLLLFIGSFCLLGISAFYLAGSTAKFLLATGWYHLTHRPL